jgi:hypothetical protein
MEKRGSKTAAHFRRPNNREGGPVKLGIVFNAEQAQVVVKKKTQVDKILCFCPQAESLLLPLGYDIIRTVDVYGSYLHAKTAVAVRDTLDKTVNDAATFYKLVPGEASSLRVYLFYFLCTAYYIYLCAAPFKNAAGFYWEKDGRIQETSSFEDFIVATIDQANSLVNLYSQTNYSLMNLWVSRFLNKKLIARTMPGSTVRTVDFVNPATKHIMKALVQADKSHISYTLRRMGTNAGKAVALYLKTCKWLDTENRDYKEAVPLFKAIDPRKYKKFKHNVPHLPIENAAIEKAVRENVIKFLPVLKAEYAYGKKAVAMVKANLQMGDHAMYPHIRGAIEALATRTNGQGVSLMVNHGTYNTQKQNRISELVQKLWASQDRLLTEYTNIYIPKSPQVLALTKEIYPDYQYEVKPVPIFERVPQLPYKKDEDFIIVHAGNYTDVYTRIGWMHVPWCRETSYEYLAQTLEFIEAMKDVEGIKLVVKLKQFKFDPHYATVKTHIGKLGMSHKVELRTDDNFKEIIHKCHLLVSNLSTTMEESVPSNIPTMLYTWRKKYFHFPCSFEPASEANKALIYGVKRKEDAAGMVKSIMAHYDSLIQQKNIGIAWQSEDLIDVKAFAKEIADKAKRVKE